MDKENWIFLRAKKHVSSKERRTVICVSMDRICTTKKGRETENKQEHVEAKLKQKKKHRSLNSNK